ncbi:hypothetical protein AN963_13430 [Brevibacillus choshinensis]|uniref:Uncharacterized protein n=1 Tax=Brevibacillus choshinensis TaxID=54911 RepID=A0ABR5N5W9_BRECH|nr:hypothetical protein AN963_13430 [Brevibacillus choshinensis]
MSLSERLEGSFSFLAEMKGGVKIADSLVEREMVHQKNGEYIVTDTRCFLQQEWMSREVK